jgi:hypothetical protein
VTGKHELNVRVALEALVKWDGGAARNAEHSFNTFANQVLDD